VLDAERQPASGQQADQGGEDGVALEIGRGRARGHSRRAHDRAPALTGELTGHLDGLQGAVQRPDLGVGRDDPGVAGRQSEHAGLEVGDALLEHVGGGEVAVDEGLPAGLYVGVCVHAGRLGGQGGVLAADGEGDEVAAGDRGDGHRHGQAEGGPGRGADRVTPGEEDLVLHVADQHQVVPGPGGLLGEGQGGLVLHDEDLGRRAEDGRLEGGEPHGQADHGGDGHRHPPLPLPEHPAGSRGDRPRTFRIRRSPGRPHEAGVRGTFFPSGRSSSAGRTATGWPGWPTAACLPYWYRHPAGPPEVQPGTPSPGHWHRGAGGVTPGPRASRPARSPAW